MIRHKLTLIVVMIVSLVAVAVLVTSCGKEDAPPAEPPTQAPEPTAAPTQAPEPTAAPTEEAEPTAAPTEEAEPTAAPTEEAEPTAAPTQAPEPTAAPTQAPEPTPVPTQEAWSGGDPGRVDLDAIFPPGRGRELILYGCSSCHNFVPIVILGLDAEEWDRVGRDHRDRVVSISDEDFNIMLDYAKEHFGPDDPVPELPRELLDQWTSY